MKLIKARRIRSLGHIQRKDLRNGKTNIRTETNGKPWTGRLIIIKWLNDVCKNMNVMNVKGM